MIDSRRARRGFTLIELLVAMGIIGILVLLALVGVQSAREASRRMECGNHLRQIGLAIQNYLAGNGCFPPLLMTTAEAYPGGPKYAAHYHSPLVRILPELERPALFHAVNFTWSMIEWWAVEVDNQTVLKTSVGVFLCPSAPRCEVPGFGRCDYRVNVGSSAAPLSENGTHGGPFGHIKMGTPATTTDGLSNTAAVSERVQGDWIRDRFRPRGDLRFIRDLKPLPLEPDPAIAACRDVADPPANVHESRGGESWFYTGYTFTGYNHAATPNFEAGCVRGEPNFELSARIKMAGVVPATSLHPGGVNVLMLDGSARFAKGAIDVRTWRALGTRGGGEVVGDW